MALAMPQSEQGLTAGDRPQGRNVPGASGGRETPAVLRLAFKLLPAGLRRKGRRPAPSKAEGETLAGCPRPPAAGGPPRSFASAQDKPARRHRHEPFDSAQGRPAVSTHGGGARVSSAGGETRPTQSAVRAI